MRIPFAGVCIPCPRLTVRCPPPLIPCPLLAVRPPPSLVHACYSGVLGALERTPMAGCRCPPTTLHAPNEHDGALWRTDDSAHAADTCRHVLDHPRPVS
jgi:hypothetical protein